MRTPGLADGTTRQRQADTRLIAVLCFTVYLATAGGQPAPALYPAVSRDFGISSAIVGQLSTVGMFTGIVMTLSLAPLSDVFGRKRMILAGLFASLLGGLLSAIAPSFVALLLVRLFVGAGFAGITPSVYALIADRFNGRTRATAIGAVTSCLSLGGILTNVIMTQMAALTSWRGSVWLYVGMAASGTVALFFLLPADAPLVKLERGGVRALFGRGMFAPLEDGPTRALIGSNIMRSLHWFAMITYLSSLFSDVYGVGIAQIGFLSLLTSVGYVVGVNISSRCIPRFGPQRVNVWANALAFPLLLLETGLLAPLPIMLVFAMAYHACMGAGYATQQTLLLAVTPARRRGKTTGLNAATVQVGGVAASLLGGVVIHTLGYRWLGPALAWSGVAAAVWVMRGVAERTGRVGDIEIEDEGVAAVAVTAQPGAATGSAK